MKKAKCWYCQIMKENICEYNEEYFPKRACFDFILDDDRFTVEEFNNNCNSTFKLYDKGENNENKSDTN